MRIFYCAILLLFMTVPAAGGLTSDALLWCHDAERSVVTRKSAFDCKGDIVNDDAARRIRERREDIIRRRMREKPPLVPGKRPGGGGTGFFVSAAGHVITNHHVIRTCAAVSVTASGGSAVVARVVASDPGNDLALLLAPLNVPAAAWFRAPLRLLPGDDVSVVGFPLLGRVVIRPVMVTGHVYAGRATRTPNRIALKIDIRKGNSGSPVLDRSGYVVGVISGDVNTPGVFAATGRMVRDVGIAIRQAPILQLLRRNAVPFVARTSGVTITNAELFRRARQFVARIRCWK